jgi:tryptophanase
MRTRIEPYRVKVVEPLPVTTAEEREEVLALAGWNLFRVPAEMVTVDLLTDSGLTAMSARQWAAIMDGDEAYAGARSFQRFQEAVCALTGYEHVIPVHQGRAGERLLFENTLMPGDVVPGNTHFDTTRANIERLGARALDLPAPGARSPALPAPFKGNVDIEALEDTLADGRVRVPFVVITATSNSCGGQPVSLENLRQASRVCRAAGVPLYLDAARFAENAWLVREREAGMADVSPRAIARAMFDLADGCLMSAKKDGLVNIGGFLALRDGRLAGRLRGDMVVGEGFPTYGGLAGRDLEAIAVGLDEVLDPRYLADRIAQVRSVGERLHAAGVPVMRPTGGHAVYLDSRAFAPHIHPLELPGQAIACELYRYAGVRACEIGQLMSGRPDANGVERQVPLDLVRLAIPRRVYTCCHLDYVVEAVCDVYAGRQRLSGFEIVEQPPALRHFTAALRPAMEIAHA